MFDIKAELKKLPDMPGVYIMRDKDDNVIYVGKAKVLKNRVRQYFQNSGKHSIKVLKMVENIDHFEYIVTNTELEALILENSLIKKHSPKYNIRLKDDKTYPYIKVTLNEMFPRVFMTRRYEKDKAKYFGPFTSSITVKENIDLIHKIWNIRRCQRVFPRDLNKERPCLNYHIGRCQAPCNQLISEKEYDKMIDEVVEFLSGRTENVIKKLTEKMLEYSENLEFEKAGEVRDTIQSVKYLSQKQIVESLKGDEKDIIGYVRGENEECVVQVFFIRGGKISGREYFMLENTEGSSDRAIMTDFVEQFYSGTPYVPKEVVLQCEIENIELISSYLTESKGQKVSIIIPQKGERKRLVDMARNNAQIILDKFSKNISREKERTIGALEEIKNVLEIDFDLERIESYDISNTQGFESVASMVVFERGLPKRSDYRKFKIKTVIGSDDYASMSEVIHRRFTRYLKEKSGENVKKAGFDRLPSMIFVDGGKGQINAVKEVLDDLGIFVPVCGMVKDERHRTRAILYKGKERVLDTHSEGFKLVTRIQDEVHRFAIDYHRQLRSKRQVKSILEEIKGVGEKRRKALMSHFKDIEKIKDASFEDLKSVEGMNASSAQAVYDFFRGVCSSKK